MRKHTKDRYHRTICNCYSAAVSSIVYRVRAGTSSLSCPDICVSVDCPSDAGRRYGCGPILFESGLDAALTARACPITALLRRRQHRQALSGVWPRSMFRFLSDKAAARCICHACKRESLPDEAASARASAARSSSEPGVGE